VSGNGIFILKYNSAGTIVGFTNIDGSGNDQPYSVCLDYLGNFYISGYYNSTTTVQINNLALNSTPVSSTYTLPLTSAQTAFYLKYNSTGTLTAFTTLPASGPNSFAYSIRPDSLGNLYVSGQYISTTTVQINNLALNSSLVSSGYTLPPANTSGSSFILKYNSAGTLVAFTNFDATATDAIRATTVDSTGNFYAAGFYTSSTTVQINNLALNSTVQSSGYTMPLVTTQALFVLKYNSNGTLTGFMNLDGTGTVEIIYDITTDSSNNVYMTGRYNSTTTVQINNLVLNSSLFSSGYTLPNVTGGSASMILKYNSLGSLVAFTRLDGSANSDYGTGVVVDSNGNLYATGSIAGTTTTQINNLALNSSLVSSGYTFPVISTSSAFLLKYNSSGVLTGFSSQGPFDLNWGVALDNSGSIYTIGRIAATTTSQINNLALNSTPVNTGYIFPTPTSDACFILKYSFSDTTTLSKSIYLQSPGNYYTINKGPSSLTVGPTSNIIRADWTLDRWNFGIE
jgi:hypothetical protein